MKRLAFAAAASGALYFASVGLGSLWPLAWVAPAPVVWAALGARRDRHAAAAAFAAYLLGQANMLPLYVRVLPPVAIAVVLALSSATFAAVVVLTRRASATLPPVAAALVFPALTTAAELAVAHLSPHGTAGSGAYAQAPFVALIAVSKLTGLSGITFVVALVASAAAFAARERGRAAARHAIAPAVALGAALAAGALASAGDGGRRLTIGLAASDAALDAFGTDDASAALAVVDAYAARVRALAARGAEVVVFPEKMVTVRDATRDEARARFAAAAREAHATVVVGLDERHASGERRNLAVVFGPAGDVVATYDKQHLVPGWEDRYTSGDALAWALPGVGVAVCKDMDFPALGRRYAREGAGLVVVPAWDFGVDAELHARMAVLRGVEGGFAVARAADDGRLTVADARGRIVAEAPSGRDASLVATVDLGRGGTPYARGGDAFGAFVAALGVALVAIAEVRRRRSAVTALRTRAA